MKGCNLDKGKKARGEAFLLIYWITSRCYAQVLLAFLHPPIRVLLPLSFFIFLILDPLLYILTQCLPSVLLSCSLSVTLSCSPGLLSACKILQQLRVPLINSLSSVLAWKHILFSPSTCVLGSGRVERTPVTQRWAVGMSLYWSVCPGGNHEFRERLR